MHKFLASMTFCVATLGLGAQAVAAPFVQTGSTYSLYLGEASASDPLFVVPVFDGAPEGGSWNGLNLTFTESETALDDGRALISIQIRSNGEMFPASDGTAVYGIGIFGDALDFLREVTLFDARVSFFNSSNKLVSGTDNLASDVEQNRPWDGLFPASDNLFGSEEIGGLGITGINFDFYIGEDIAEVPAPAGMWLYGIGLTAVLAMQRRRQKIFSLQN